MVKQATTLNTCCYVGCTKSFLADKETTTFLRFPDDEEKRKKWISNCGNTELSSLAERQLRGKRICINHFPASAIIGIGEKKTVKEFAIPIHFKKAGTPSPVTPTSSTKSVAVSPSPKPVESGSGSAPPTVKRGRGRPPKIKPEIIIKSEPADEESDEEQLQVDTQRTSTSNTDGWKPFAPAVEKTADTPHVTTKDKAVVAPGTIKQKPVSVAGTNKEKPASTPGTAKSGGSTGTPKEKPSTVQGTPKEKSVTALGTPKEKPVSALGAPKEKPVSTLGTPKEKPVGILGTPKEKPVSALGVPKEKPISTLGAPKEKPVSTLGTPKEKPVSTIGAPKEKPVSTLGTPKEKPVSTLGTLKEKPVSTLGTPKEKPVSTLGAPKEKPVSTLGTPKEKPVSTLGAPKEKPVSTLGTPKEKPVSAIGTRKDKSGSTLGKTKEKPVSKEKPVVTPIATDAAKEKPSVTASVESSVIKKTNRKVTGKIRTNVAKGKVPPAKEKGTANVNDAENAAAGSDKGDEKSLIALGPPKEKLGSVKFLKEDAAVAVNSVPSGALKDRKRKKMTKTEKDLKSKIRRIAVDILQPNSEVMDVDLSSSSSCEDLDEEGSNSLGSSEDEEKRTSVADNREFERFHKTLKTNCVLPDSWNLGAVLWDPNRKMKVIPASEVDISSTGSVRLKRSVQIFESMQTKVTVDGFDLTNRYDVKTVSAHQDVTRLILRVARSKICCGIKSISAEDAMYFPDAVPRGTTFYSEACPVIISKQSMGPLCNSCHKLRNAIRRRKSEQKRAVEMRKAKRSSLHTVNSPFGKALYTLLADLMADENDPKRKKRRNTLYSRGHNVCLKDKDGDGDKNASERSTNTASISYIMQDIVSKMSLGKMPQEQQPQFFKSEDDQMGMQILNGTLDSNSGNLVVQNAADFTLAEGQEYELIGEVDPNDVQVVEMIKERPNSPQIEIIEVDDHTLAQLAAQNMSGMFLQDSGQIHVNMSEVDVNNPAMSQLLKVIAPSHGF